MKAVLLCAGIGSRMSGLVKGLLHIEGKAIMHHWVDRLRSVGVTDIIINLHHHAESFITYAEITQIPGLTFTYEPELLGSAGTIYANRRLLGRDSFLIVYCDVWTKAPLFDLIATHVANGALMTIMIDCRQDLSACGVVELHGDEVISFEEKPEYPKGDHSFSGIAMAEPGALNTLSKDMKDVGKDWLPSLVGKMNAHIVEDEVIDIGTPADYERVRYG